MATVYQKFLLQLSTGGFDWVNDSVKLSYVKSSVYTPDFNNDEFGTAISAAIVETTDAFTAKAVVAEASPLTSVLWTGTVPLDVGVSGDEFDALVLHTATGSSATNRLIAYHDVFSGTYPLDPDNDDITVSAPAWMRL